MKENENVITMIICAFIIGFLLSLILFKDGLITFPVDKFEAYKIHQKLSENEIKMFKIMSIVEK